MKTNKKVYENIFEKISDKKNIYSLVNNNYFVIKRVIDMESNYQKLFHTNVSYLDFLKRLLQDNYFRYDITLRLKEKYKNNNIKVITDITGCKWYIIILKKPKINFNYIYNIGMLNKFEMYSNYYDLFNNKIIFNC